MPGPCFPTLIKSGRHSSIAYFDCSMFTMLAEKCWHSSAYLMDPGNKGCFFVVVVACPQPLNNLLSAMVTSPE